VFYINSNVDKNFFKYLLNIFLYILKQLLRITQKTQKTLPNLIIVIIITHRLLSQNVKTTLSLA